MGEQNKWHSIDEEITMRLRGIPPSNVHERYPGMNEYVRDAMRTSAETGSIEDELAVCGLGLSGESGEIADRIKKILFHGHPLTTDEVAKMVEELGDVLWYVARCARAIGSSLDAVAAGNVDKLAVRYPDGFSSELSRNRKEAADAAARGTNWSPPRNDALEKITEALRSGDTGPLGGATPSVAANRDVHTLTFNGERVYDPPVDVDRTTKYYNDKTLNDLTRDLFGGADPWDHTDQGR